MRACLNNYHVGFVRFGHRLGKEGESLNTNSFEGFFHGKAGTRCTVQCKLAMSLPDKKVTQLETDILDLEKQLEAKEEEILKKNQEIAAELVQYRYDLRNNDRGNACSATVRPCSTCYNQLLLMTHFAR